MSSPGVEPGSRGSRPRASASCAMRTLVPLGGLEPPPHGSRARHAALTPRRERWSRHGAPNPVLRLTKAPCSPKNTMAAWSEWPDSNRHLRVGGPRSSPLDDTRVGSAYGYRTRPSTLATWDACLHTQAEQRPAVRPATTSRQFSKTPTHKSGVGGQQGIRTQPLPEENGVTTRQRTIRTYCPNWRQRQDSNPEPRGLEARMLPLHHAAVRRPGY